METGAATDETRSVSVVIPAFNAARDVDRQLAALSVQTYSGPVEIVVADNGSSDDTSAVVAGWRQRGLPVRLVEATERRGPSVARNSGARAARGDLLVFTDADDEAAPDWLGALVAGLGDADVVAGWLDYAHLNGGGRTRPQSPHPRQFHFLPAGLGANLGIRRACFEAMGGFDESLPVGEDLDLCWRAQLAGWRFREAPAAVVHKRERADERERRRQSFDYGRGDPVLFRRFRDQGMPRATWLTVKTWIWLLVNLPGAVLTARRQLWLRVLHLRAGRLVGSLEQRVAYL